MCSWLLRRQSLEKPQKKLFTRRIALALTIVVLPLALFGLAFGLAYGLTRGTDGDDSPPPITTTAAEEQRKQVRTDKLARRVAGLTHCAPIAHASTCMWGGALPHPRTCARLPWPTHRQPCSRMHACMPVPPAVHAITARQQHHSRRCCWTSHPSL